MFQTYVVYEIQGYERYERTQDLYMGCISIKVIAHSEAEAIAAAKARHPSRSNFRVMGSIEYLKESK